MKKKNTLLLSRIRLQALAAYEVGGGTILSSAEAGRGP